MPLIPESEVKLIHRYICEGVGDPNRLRLLYLVADQPYNVSELTELLSISQPTVSHHLRILRERGLVNADRHGTSIYYTLSDLRIITAMEILRSYVADLMKQNSQILNEPGQQDKPV